MKKIVLILSILLVTIACGSNKDDNSITVQTPGQAIEREFYEKVNALFTEKTGIKVNMQTIPPNPEDRLQTIVTAMRSKQKDPDVLFMDVAWVGQLIGAKWLQSLPIDMTPFFEGTVKNVVNNQKEVYAVPMFVDLGMFFYRKDLLAKYNQKVPTTWQELVKIAQIVQSNERATGNNQFWGYTWTGAQTETLIVYFLEHAMSKGFGLYDTNGNFNLFTSENKEALQTLVDFSAKNNIVAPDNHTRGESETMEFFQTGNVLFERNWPFVWNIHNSEGSIIKDKVGIALIPKYDSGKHVSGLGGWFVGVSAFSDKKDLAQQWVEFATSYDVQLMMGQDLAFFSGRKDIYQNEDLLAKYPVFKEFKTSLPYAVARPTVPYYPEMAKILKEKFNAAISGVLTVDQALKQAQTEIDAIIQQYTK